MVISIYFLSCYDTHLNVYTHARTVAMTVIVSETVMVTVTQTVTVTNTPQARPPPEFTAALNRSKSQPFSDKNSLIVCQCLVTNKNAGYRKGMVWVTMG